MSCKEYVDALTELALGGEADARLRAHLTECAACRAEQERLAHLASAMDRGVAAMMDAQPSPGFAARVRQRVTEESERRVSSWSGWVPALAGGLAVAILAVWLGWSGAGRQEPSPGTGPAINASGQSPVNPTLPIPAPPFTGTQSPTQRAANASNPARARAESSRSKPADLPEVLVAGDEWKQVVKLYALAQRGGVNSEQLAPPDAAPLEGTVQPLAIAKLEGQPIAIQPLAENPPGAQRQ